MGKNCVYMVRSVQILNFNFPLYSNLRYRAPYADYEIFFLSITKSLKRNIRHNVCVYECMMNIYAKFYPPTVYSVPNLRYGHPYSEYYIVRYKS